MCRQVLPNILFHGLVLLALGVSITVARPRDPPHYRAEYGTHQPQAYRSHNEKGKPYSYAYKVYDPYHGTDFGANEDSDGDQVKGSYNVVLPDGRKQIVKYTANHYAGYEAEVEFEGEPKHPPPSPYNPPLYESPAHIQTYAPSPPSYSLPPTPKKYILSDPPSQPSYNLPLSPKKNILSDGKIEELSPKKYILSDPSETTGKIEEQSGNPPKNEDEVESNEIEINQEAPLSNELPVEIEISEENEESVVSDEILVKENLVENEESLENEEPVVNGESTPNEETIINEEPLISIDPEENGYFIPVVIDEILVNGNSVDIEDFIGNEEPVVNDESTPDVEAIVNDEPLINIDPVESEETVENEDPYTNEPFVGNENNELNEPILEETAADDSSSIDATLLIENELANIELLRIEELEVTEATYFSELEIATYEPPEDSTS